MPIIDYKARAKREIINFSELKTISEKNKAIIKDFLVSYETSRSSARVSLFLRHIRKFLEKTPDVESLIYSAKDHTPKEFEKVKEYRLKVDRIFNTLKNEIGLNYYATVVNVSLMLVKNLHNDTLPDSFKQIKRVEKKKQKRHLKSSDMWAWEDGLKASNTTNNIQSKAIILTQLDAGMRPSEFLDLNYGDVRVLKDVIALEDKATKNDKADPVILYRSVPYFLKWFNSHPTKNPNDPLWLIDKLNADDYKRYGVKRLTYSGLNRKISLMREKADIKKPFDFYNLRHSSCYLDKIENLPVELAAKRHRHSTGFFIDTYGRLDVMDTADRYRTHYGIAKENKEKPKNRTCEMCGYVNEPDKDMCDKCNRPLTLQKAMEMQTSPEEALKSIISNPEMLAQLQKALSLTPEQRKEELKKRKQSKN